MTLSLNGYEVFLLIGGHAALFPDLKADVARLAEALVRKQLTQPGVTLKAFTDMSRVLGDDTVSLVLQTFDAAELKALVRRLDPHRRRIGTGGTQAERFLLDLAHGRVKPVRKQSARKGASRAGKRPAARTPRTGAVQPPSRDPRRRAPLRRAATPFATASMAPVPER